MYILASEPPASQYPLIDAAKEGNIFLVKELLKNGADVNSQNKNGETALMVAARSTSPKVLEIMQTLIAAKADVNIQNNDGETALMWANWYWIYNRKALEIVKTLIAAKANVNIQNNNGWTALMGATLSTSPQALSIVKIFIAAKANVNIRNKDGNTALMFAALSNNRQFVKMIKILIAARCQTLHIKNNDGKTVYDVLLDKHSMKPEDIDYLLYSGK